MNNIIAIVGQAGSGKDTAANYIEQKYGYKHISTADILREIIHVNNLGDLTRENMANVIHKLRQEKGNDVLVSIALDKHKDKKIVLSALRHPDESKFVKSLGGVIIASRADFESRYNRNHLRGREGDNISEEKFRRLEENENSGDGFDINQVETSADYIIKNNGTYSDFYDQIDEAMRQIQAK